MVRKLKSDKDKNKSTQEKEKVPFEKKETKLTPQASKKSASFIRKKSV